MLKLTISGNWAEESTHGLPAWLVGWKAGAIFLGGLYTCLMLSALLGIFQRYFAGQPGWWKYLADASYWCYLAGFPIQAALQVWMAPQALPIVIEFLLVNALTFTVLLVSYELCVRHSWVGLMLNGKRPERKPAAQPEPVIVISTRLPFPAAEETAAPNAVPQPSIDRDPPTRRREHPAKPRRPGLDEFDGRDQMIAYSPGRLIFAAEFFGILLLLSQSTPSLGMTVGSGRASAPVLIEL